MKYSEYRKLEKERREKRHIGTFDYFKCKLCGKVMYFAINHLRKKHDIEIKRIIPLLGSELTEEASQYLEKWDKKAYSKEEIEEIEKEAKLEKLEYIRKKLEVMEKEPEKPQENTEKTEETPENQRKT